MTYQGIADNTGTITKVIDPVNNLSYTSSYVVVGVGYDGTNIAVTLSLGLSIITNAAATVSLYFAYYPNKKSVEDLRGWGVSIGASYSVGVHLGIGGAAELQAKGHGVSAGIGAGVSFAPVPYFQVKFGYSWVWYWEIPRIKNNTSCIRYISWLPNSKFSVTKKKDYTDIYIYRMKKTIRVYYSKRRKVF